MTIKNYKLIIINDDKLIDTGIVIGGDEMSENIALQKAKEHVGVLEI